MRPRSRPYGWDSIPCKCAISAGNHGIHKSASGGKYFCFTCDAPLTGSARWGPEWMMVAALAVACESDCDLHPTEVMKALMPELSIGPGMVIEQEF